MELPHPSTRIPHLHGSDHWGGTLSEWKRETGHHSHDGAHEGHEGHGGHSPEMFRDRFWLSLALSIPVVVWSGHIQELLGYQAPEFPGARWIPPVLGTVVFLYGGLVFPKGPGAN